MSPTDMAITPRDLRFHISRVAQRHWYGGDPIKTAVTDCFSIYLPEGERFFIRALKHYAPQISDPKLSQDIKGFCLQEAYHTREHEDYNASLAALGYDLETMEGRCKAPLDRVTNPLMRLVFTCVIEHLTATFAVVVLRSPGLLGDAAPAYRSLWLWHALEELEHNAVALDVLHAVTPNMPGWKRYLLRVGAMNTVVAIMLATVTRNVVTYARHDGHKPGVRFWLTYAKVMLVRPAFTMRGALHILRFFLPGFQPRSMQDTKLFQRGQEMLQDSERAAAG